MGTSLVKNYSVDKEPYLTAGYKNMWKIYKGTHKVRETPASVFVFDKKALDIYSNKDEKEELISLLRKESQILQKFKHPGILGVQESLLEDKTTLAFVTEYIPHSLSSWIASGNVSKLEIKLLLIELCEVFRFFQEDAKVVLLNISPDTIFLDEKAKIKVSGFNFAITDPPNSGSEFSLRQSMPNTWPNLSMLPPEGVYGSKRVNYKSDVFSLGLLTSFLLNKANKNQKEGSLLDMNSTSIESYKRLVENQLQSRISSYCSNLDQEDRVFLTDLLIKEESIRPSILQVKDNKWFQDFKLNALTFIDNLESNDKHKNELFLTQFPNILSQFDEKIIKKKILTKLLDVIQLDTLMALVIPCVFAIGESKSCDVNFETVIWPSMKNIFKMKQIPAVTLYFLMTKTEYIANNLSKEEFSNNMLNIICKCLDCNVPKIQGVVIQNLGVINKKIDSHVFRNQIYQRLANILLNTKNYDLMITILKNIKSSITLLDKSTINDSLLATLEKLRKQDNKLETCQTLVEVYEEVSTVVNIESISNKILPNLIGIMVSGELTQKLFTDIMKIVQKYLDKLQAFRQKDFTAVDEKKSQSEDIFSSSNASNQINLNSGDFLSQFFNQPVKGKTQSDISSTLQQGSKSSLPDFTYGNNNKGDMFDFNELNSDILPNQNNQFNQSSTVKHQSFNQSQSQLKPVFSSKQSGNNIANNMQSSVKYNNLMNFEFDKPESNKENQVNYDEFFTSFGTGKGQTQQPQNQEKKSMILTKKDNKDNNLNILDFSKPITQKKDTYGFDFSNNQTNQNKKKDDPFNFDFSNSNSNTKTQKKKNDLEDLLNFG